MDGTLLNPEGRFTARTISALKDARAHGAVVTLSSGRMPCALRPFVKELGIDAPLICYNGALTADSRTEAPLSSTPLSPEMAREIARACEERELHIQAYRGEAFVCAAMVKYRIDADKCRGCTLCKRNCPADAIAGEVRRPHSIDPAKCVSCGACASNCKFGAIEKYSGE